MNVAGAETPAPASEKIDDVLACPSCGSGVGGAGGTLACASCGLALPLVTVGDTKIPWAFADPNIARLEWKARYLGFLHNNSTELARLRQARTASFKAARERVERLLHAREQYRKQIGDILEPLALDALEWPADTTDLLHGKLPKSQGLCGYVSNVFRDWAWNNGENEAQLAAVRDALDAANASVGGRVLTLGAGSGRLSYDLHRHYSPELSVVLDLNPLLTLISAHMASASPLELYEFPVAPLDAASFAVEQTLEAPAAIPTSEYRFVLGDALDPPIQHNTFDTLLTPWLIDIVPQNLAGLMPRFNRCLKPGGIWINTGSLAFFHQEEAWRYSEEEVLELLGACGFEVLASARDTVPYLQSPHSGYGRVEKAFTFVARKVHDVEPTAPERYLPGWIVDNGKPIPATAETPVAASNHLLKAQVLSSIDGKKTIRQIGRAIARQYGLGKDETIRAVRQILIDAWEQSSERTTTDDL